MTTTPAQAPQHPRRLPHGWRGEALRIGLLLVLLLAFRSTLANHYVVPSGSMMPTLQPGDRVLVDMSAYGLRVPFTDAVVIGRGTPVRGDVVVFTSPADGVRMIKRLVALPGDHVQMHDGRLWINGQPQAVPGPRALEVIGAKVVALELRSGGGPDIDRLVIPAGQALVVGDHRGDSLDGRFFGLVPVSAFYARAVAVYWRRGEGPVWRGMAEG